MGIFGSGIPHYDKCKEFFKLSQTIQEKKNKIDQNRKIVDDLNSGKKNTEYEFLEGVSKESSISARGRMNKSWESILQEIDSQDSNIQTAIDEAIRIADSEEKLMNDYIANDAKKIQSMKDEIADLEKDNKDGPDLGDIEIAAKKANLYLTESEHQRKVEYISTYPPKAE